MAAEWTKIGTSIVTGAVAGILDQRIHDWDEERKVEAVMAQAGTYYNYGLPIIILILAAFGILKGDWLNRLMTAGAQLAGRRATYQIAKPQQAQQTQSPWTKAQQRQSAWIRTQQAGKLPQTGSPHQPVTTQGAINVGSWIE